MEAAPGAVAGPGLMTKPPPNIHTHTHTHARQRTACKKSLGRNSGIWRIYTKPGMITAVRPRSRYFALLMLERVALLLEWMAVIWRFLKQSPGHLNVARHASTTFPSLRFPWRCLVF